MSARPFVAALIGMVALATACSKDATSPDVMIIGGDDVNNPGTKRAGVWYY